MRIGSSLALLAIGAILAFAVTINPTPMAGLTVHWDTVGVILMVIGAIGLVWSLIALSSLRDRNRVAGGGYVEQPPVVERDTYIR